MNEIKLNKRWQLAQSYERKVWDSMTKKELLEYSKKYYLRKVQKLLKESKKKIKINKKTKFLQIGPGPTDIINQIKIGEKYSIDPLADFYKKKFNFNYDETKLIRGVGEKLPYKDHFFDVIIFANVLDHTDSPGKVLSEISRVLKSDGILYVEAHFYQKEFILLSKVYGFFKRIFTGEIFNPCHPHMFQLEQIKKLIMRSFKIYDEKIGEDIEKEISDLRELKTYLKKQKFTQKLPATFGLFGIINYTCFCQKKSVI